MSSHLESYIETAVTEYSITKGMNNLKLNVSGRIGWPDRIFLFRSIAFFIEFKRAGEPPRKAQLYVHGILEAQGFKVYVVDNIPYGKEVIDGQVRLSQVRT